MATPCEAKRFYDTEFEATIAAARAEADFKAEMLPYHCRYGNHWHIRNKDRALMSRFRKAGQRTYCKYCDCYLKVGSWVKHRQKLGHQRNVRKAEIEKERE
jgi:hypothetical protein